jgi:hypothetical protein
MGHLGRLRAMLPCSKKEASLVAEMGIELDEV